MNDPDKDNASTTAEVARIVFTGVRNRGWTSQSFVGRCPRSAIANSSRVPGVNDAPYTPAHATMAVIATTIPPMGPIKLIAASASGRCDVANVGRVPTHTIWSDAYSTSTTAIETMIANGTDRAGSRTSPASTEVESKPKNAKAASSMAL